jgi:methionyl-tRNA formyltransferase
MNVCILTTDDNFYLGNLLKKLSFSKKYKFSYIFIKEHDIKISNFKKILVRLASIGIFQSIKYFSKDLLIRLQKKDIINFLREKEKKILIIKSIKDKNIRNFLKKNQISLLLSINFPKKIPLKILKLQKYGGINVHLGKLPEFKGLYPVIRMLIAGEKYCFITIHRMIDKIDCGKILKEKKIFVKRGQNLIIIYQKLFKESEKIIYQSIKSIMSNTFLKKKKSKGNYYGQPSGFEILKIIRYTFFNKIYEYK